MDETDNDPFRFWKYVIRAVSGIVSEEMKPQLLTLLSEHTPLEALMDYFINIIEAVQNKIYIYRY